MLVVAPHGGLCRRDLLAPDGDGTLRGNDLHTCEVAEELASRLDATLVANVAVDRNELDLNRIDEVEARAPWFLALLHAELERILARHEVAQVLFVHGWHVVQPQCDVGIGARLASAQQAFECQTCLTVPPGYVLGSLALLEREAARDGLRTTFGERWPAAHANNVMQLFRRHGGRPPGAHGAALRALAASGRVRAVQLELAAPLRWPGRWRERFVAAAAAAFTRPIDAPCEAPPAASPLGARPAAAPAGKARFALQAHDPQVGEAGLGIVVVIGPLSRDELGARLLLLPGGQRMLLFTGHARMRPGEPLAVAGLRVSPCDGGVAVRFAGPVLDLPDARRHFAHEPAQLDARVVEAEVELRYVPEADGYGRIEGSVAVAGRSWRVAAHGFTEPVLARPAPREAGQGTRLTASFGGELGLTVDLGSAGGAARLWRATPGGRTTHALDGGAAPPRLADDRLPEPFAVPLGDETLVCTPRSHVTILRPVRSGLFARVTFGAAHYRLGTSLDGSGFYEHTTALAAGTRNGEDA